MKIKTIFLWLFLMINVIFYGCVRNEVIYNEGYDIRDGSGVDIDAGNSVYDIGDNTFLEEIDDIKDTESIEELGEDEIKDILQGTRDDVGCNLWDVVVIDPTDTNITYDSYEYPDYGEQVNENLCNGEVDKRFTEDWNIKINGLLFWDKSRRPSFAYFKGRLYTVLWGGTSYNTIKSHFTVVNSNGEIEYYSIGAGHYSNPVVDENGDVYFTSSTGELLLYKIYEEAGGGMVDQPR